MSESNVKHLNDSTFDDAVSSGVALIDFWAPWCGPCRMQGPILEDVADHVGDTATIAKVNVDEARDLAIRFGIRSIPTLVVLRDGEAVQQFIGVQQAATLVKAMADAAAD